MGDEAEAAERKAQMMPYQVTSELLGLASPTPCSCTACRPTPARKSQEVLDSPQNIFDEAENRLHTQKAIMAKLVELNQ